MNPYPWLAGLLLIIVVAVGADRFGHSRGVDQQRLENQKVIDQINTERANQKAEAAEIYRKAQDNIIALQTQRDALKRTLGAQDAANRKATADKYADYVGSGLRFTPQSSGNRPNGSDPVSTGTNAASVAGSTVIQLPGEIEKRLWDIARDADDLKTAYATCYRWANQVR